MSKNIEKSNQGEYLLKTNSQAKWQRTGVSKRAGVLLPLFSIYSRDSIGVGDLGDLKLAIDWCSKTGNSILQLLPMNEVGSLFCPYDSMSSFALEPLYLSLKLMHELSQKPIKPKIEELKKIFPTGKAYVDYRIKQEKMRLLWDIFNIEHYHNPRFNEFILENAYWIENFALYKVIKKHQEGRAWYEWEEKFRNRNRQTLEHFEKEHEQEITFVMWIQWQLYEQFQFVRVYAQKKKVLLKGDLPILVSRDSADVWARQEFFKLEFAAGAPADLYCAKGQRWGMPTYNWHNIATDNFRYLKEKLKYAQNFYDILRIDHVVGLFRIWSIPYKEPLEKQGLNGFFDPRNESEWDAHGRKILSVMLESTKMLLCAEDLGVIPKMCLKALEEFGIPGNDVQRWMKDWSVKHDFLEPQSYRKLSVAMLSTHDTTNWPAWWENEAGTVDEGLFIRKCSDFRQIDFDRVREKLFDLTRSCHGRLRWLDSIDSIEKLVDILGKRREAVGDFIDIYENTHKEKEKLWRHLNLTGPMREDSDREIVKRALKITLESNAIFCINTIIDWLYLSDIFKGNPYQYRTNTPGTISEKNWSLRIPLSLEDLLSHKINKDIHTLIASSGRI